MKSKQLNFFFLREDYQGFSKFFSSQNVKFIRLPIINREMILESETEFDRKSWEFSKICLTKDEFKKSIQLNWIDEMNYFLIENLKSPIMEFSRGQYNENEMSIQRSRLYYITEYFEGSELVRKDGDFIQWANDLLFEFRSIFLKKKISNGIYATDLLFEKVKNKKVELDSSETKIYLSNK